MYFKDQISCICITHRRVPLLKNAIEYFNHQLYANKELMIVFTSDDEETSRFVEQNKQFRSANFIQYSDNGKISWQKEEVNAVDSQVIFLKLFTVDQVTLGTKRNLAIQQASGEYICIWDDDDYHAKERLYHQMIFLQKINKPAVALITLNLYHEDSDTAYCSNYRVEGWEGTLLCKKSEIGVYSDLNSQEDSPVLWKLFTEKRLAIMDDPDLYTYNIHGKNTSGGTHFHAIFNLSKKLNEAETEVVKRNLKLIPEAVKKNKVYDGVLSLGSWCQVGAAMRGHNLNRINSPLHNFGVKKWHSVMDLLECRFEDVWELHNITIGKAENAYSAKHNETRSVYKVYDNKYNLLSNHHFDEDENSANELHTYPQFKEKVDVLTEIFLQQCETYEKVLFACRIMSNPEPTVIEREDIKRLSNALSKLRNDQPFDLRISVPEALYEQVSKWIEEDQMHHISLYPWTIEWNDEVKNEEWEWMFGDVVLADNYLDRLNKEIIGIEDERSMHLQYLNS